MLARKFRYLPPMSVCAYVYVDGSHHMCVHLYIYGHGSVYIYIWRRKVYTLRLVAFLARSFRTGEEGGEQGRNDPSNMGMYIVTNIAVFYKTGHIPPVAPSSICTGEYSGGHPIYRGSRPRGMNCTYLRRRACVSGHHGWLVPQSGAPRGNEYLMYRGLGCITTSTLVN
jgi:hypothetical protein